MKKYRLKADIPGHKAGEVLTQVKVGDELIGVDGHPVISYGEIQRHPDIMGWFEEVEEEWMPELWEEYWFVGDDGSLRTRAWHGDKYDLGRRTIGNCFHTEEGAEKRLKWLMAVAVLRADTADQHPDWADDKSLKWQVYYSHITGRLAVVGWQAVNYHTFVFADKERAELSLVEHEAEWRTFLGVA